MGDAAEIGKFPLIDEVNELGILVDHDISGTSQKDTVKTFERWAAAGRDVWYDMPETPGQDFNDLIG